MDFVPSVGVIAEHFSELSERIGGHKSELLPSVLC